MKSIRKHFTILILLIICLSSWSYAQRPDIKFGKVSKQELQMSTYPLDSGASAVILSDIGKSSFDYASYKGIYIVFERHIRIKILDKGGYDWANFEIPLYESSNGSRDEKIIKLKAYTFNLDEKGKVDKIKLSKDEVLTEEIDKNLRMEKFTMPGVKEGSVIDVTYKVESEFLFNLNSWQFQKSIPVAWSEYEVEIPEYFKYQKRSTGYIPFVINEQSSGTAHFNPQSTFHTQKFHWAAKDVPAFEKEFGMTSAKNYISKIKFQLASIKFPQEPVQNVWNSWEKISKELLKDEDFGKAVSRNRFLEDLKNKITDGLTSDEQKISAIYSWVKNNITWNEENDYTTSKSLKEVLTSKTGNAADINLLLIAMLQRADLNAFPLVMSTRDHGNLLPMFPMIQQLNYVIGYVQIGKKHVLLDATNKFNPIGQLPFHCLNGQGLVIKENNANQWVDLYNGEQYKTSTTVMLSFTEDFELTGSQLKTFDSMSALTLREKVNKSGTDKYFEKISEQFENWDIEETGFNKLENINSPVRRTLKLTSLDTYDGSDIIYMDMMMTGEAIDENPFKKESRVYPINYGSPVEHKYVLNLAIPEGYIIEELPEQINLTLPNNGGSYYLSVTQRGGYLQVMSIFNINKMVFVPNEYPYLKEFYNTVIAKQAQKIVLKKASAQAAASK